MGSTLVDRPAVILIKSVIVEPERRYAAAPRPKQQQLPPQRLRQTLGPFPEPAKYDMVGAEIAIHVPNASSATGITARKRGEASTEERDLIEPESSCSTRIQGPRHKKISLRKLPFGLKCHPSILHGSASRATSSRTNTHATDPLACSRPPCPRRFNSPTSKCHAHRKYPRYLSPRGLQLGPLG